MLKTVFFFKSSPIVNHKLPDLCVPIYKDTAAQATDRDISRRFEGVPFESGMYKHHKICIKLDLQPTGLSHPHVEM